MQARLARRAGEQRGEAGADGGRRVVGGRADLQRAQAAGDERDQVREGPAGIGTDDGARRAQDADGAFVSVDFVSDVASGFASDLDSDFSDLPSGEDSPPSFGLPPLPELERP